MKKMLILITGVALISSIGCRKTENQGVGQIKEREQIKVQKNGEWNIDPTTISNGELTVLYSEDGEGFHDENGAWITNVHVTFDDPIGHGDHAYCTNQNGTQYLGVPYCIPEGNNCGVAHSYDDVTGLTQDGVYCWKKGNLVVDFTWRIGER